jgi:quercetin dioxygenase-like cupin family protein
VEAIVSGPGEGESLREDERTILVKAVQPQLDVLEFTITDPGYEGPGPHYHERHVESFYVLEGELEFPAVGATVVAGPGTYVFAPPGTVHAFTNRTPARFLNIHAPETGFVEYMRAVDRGDDVDPADHDVHEVGGDEERADAIVSRPGVDLIDRSYGSVEIRAELPQLSVMVMDVVRDWDGVAPHVHDDHLDSFYVLEGEIDFLLGGERRHGAAGTLVAFPPGVEHGVAPPTGPVRLLNVHAPDAGFAASLRR